MFCGSVVGIDLFGASIFYGLLIGLHVFVAALLIVIILMQASKGGGLSGAFGTGTGSSPLFGAATSTVLVKTTTVLAVLFALTCISIAAIQARRTNIMRGAKPPKEEATMKPKEEEAPAPEEGALSPVEAEGAKETPLSPVEAGQKEKKETGAESESPPASQKEPELSPVEAEGGKKEPKPEPDKQSLSPTEGKSPANEPKPAPAEPGENVSPDESEGAAE